MEITPEIIATKIWKWKLDIYMFDLGSAGLAWVDEDGKFRAYRNQLPTFQELEWTGPLLEKAAEIGKFKIETPRKLYQKEGIYWLCVNEKTRKVSYNRFLNLAIAEAILKAEGK